MNKNIAVAMIKGILNSIRDDFYTIQCNLAFDNIDSVSKDLKKYDEYIAQINKICNEINKVENENDDDLY